MGLHKEAENMMIQSRTLALALLSLMTVFVLPARADATPSVTSTINVGVAPTSVAFTPNGKTAYVTNWDDDTVSVINVKTATVEGDPIVVGDHPRSVAFSNDGKLACVTNFGDDTVSIINVKTATVQGDPIDSGDFPRSVAFSKNGKKAYVTNEGGDTVSVITTR